MVHRALLTELRHRRSMRTPSPPGLTEEQKASMEHMDAEERAWGVKLVDVDWCLISTDGMIVLDWLSYSSSYWL